DFEHELKQVTTAWVRQGLPNTLFFGVLDFKDAQKTFGALQIRNVPIVYHFPPSGSNDKVEPETYDVPRKGKDAEDFASWVEAVAKVKIGYKKPLNYAAIFSALFVLLLVVVVGKLFSDNFLWVLQSKIVWMVTGMVFIIMMTSATMWNSIRGAEYVGVRDGKPEVIAPGFGNQYVVETQVIGLMYALVSLSFVGLVHVRDLKGLVGQWGPLALLGIFILKDLRWFTMINPDYWETYSVPSPSEFRATAPGNQPAYAKPLLKDARKSGQEKSTSYYYFPRDERRAYPQTVTYKHEDIAGVLGPVVGNLLASPGAVSDFTPRTAYSEDKLPPTPPRVAPRMFAQSAITDNRTDDYPLRHIR
ncbi:oligosaccharyl transferase subunit ost3/OST6, partial [Gonapodya sp. JEL0774]